MKPRGGFDCETNIYCNMNTFRIKQSVNTILHGQISEVPLYLISLNFNFAARTVFCSCINCHNSHIFEGHKTFIIVAKKYYSVC